MILTLVGFIATTAVQVHAATTGIDCGGAAVGSYLADTDYSGGGSDTWTNTINTTLLAAPVPPQTVLQSDREGTFTYTISGFTANSSQPLTLTFEEHYWSAAGDRVFDVTCNGTTLLSNFDIYATVGADFEAIQENFNVTANSSGQIVIGFTPVVDQASICGITVGSSGAPSAPTLSASSGSTGQVNLSWSASSGATTYDLYRGTTSGGEGSTPYATGITATSYTDTGLTAGETYYYEVAALNNSGSALSNQASAEAGAALSAPTLTSAVGTGEAIELTWTAVNGATSYNLYQGTASGGESTTPVTNSTTTSYDDTGLELSETYYFKVAAVNASGTSALSNELSMAAGQPVAPTLQTATGTGGAIEITWSGSFGATSYNVYSGTASGGEGTIPVDTTSSTSFEDTGLLTGVTYYFKVSAVNSDGTSPLSNELSASAGLPIAPTLSSAAGSSGSVALVWAAGQGATTYNVYRGTASGAESSTAIATGITALTFTNTGLTNGTTYYYKVASVNSDGTSPMSNELSATPTALTIAIDCGGAASSPFVADTDYSGGGVDTWTTTVNTSLLTGSPIPGQAVLQSDREGTFTYTVTGLVANSSHSVTMYFVEQYFSAAGERVFSVACNGTTVISNLDVYKTAGADYKAIQETFSGKANSSGQLVLSFTASVDQAKCGGILVD
ncbi:MAG: malectin domain-containing carbohydrate-binding protein [Capsulimonadaceae bacterium]